MTLTVNGTTALTFPSSTAQGDAATGYGQTWQDVTSSRAGGTTYTNSTTKPIMAAVTLVRNSTVCNGTLKVNGVIVWNPYVSTDFKTIRQEMSIIIPPGSTYLLTLGNFLVYSWFELR